MPPNDQNFKCTNCGKTVNSDKFIGTKNRNHCPNCLWSRHVDDKSAGDRAASCKGNMQPVGLTFKDEGVDKYGKVRQGELMLIHECTVCNKISINRIAADDNTEQINFLLNSELLTGERRQKLESTKIKILGPVDIGQVEVQLYGKQVD